MLYDVNLRITHFYDRPAVGARHLLRLHPPTLPEQQQRIAASLDIAPRPNERSERADFFGNAMTEAALNASHARVEITLRARIRRRANALAFDLSPPLKALAEDLAETRSLDPDSPHHFLPPTHRAPRLEEIDAFARTAAARGLTALETVRAVGEAIHGVMTFDAQATTVDTPIAEAFERRRGVCQDFSHLMIASLRSLGVPAGYVSGFLRTTPPKGQEPLQGADAMHAWVRAWCGHDMGWVEYDPTNAVFVHDDHIVLARGRDYSDVAPVRGVIRTSGAQTSAHGVDVTVVEEG